MRKLILKTGLMLCNWLIPRMRAHPDISYKEYIEVINLQAKYKQDLLNLDK